MIIVILMLAMLCSTKIRYEDWRMQNGTECK